MRQEHQNLLGMIEGVESVTYSPEDTTQGRPAILALSLDDEVSEERADDIAMRTRELVRESLTHTDLYSGPVASVEHPPGVEENEDGEIVKTDPDENKQVVKIRWCIHVIRNSLDDTRLNGRAIKEGLPSQD